MKIAVLLSGGVDSSVALRLLQEQGHELTAFYLKIWLEDELAYLGSCPWEEDLSYAQKVCDQAKIPLEVISLQREYWDSVVAYTIDQVKRGRTPSPDILCNKEIKFGCFYDKIDTCFEKVATGHYARLEERDGQFILKKAVDLVKDQTYFLSRLTQVQLSRALFPIGHLTKTQVREYAKKFGLATQERKDSQGICFLGKIKFSDFIKHHVGVKSGDLIEIETGKKVGTHEGFWFYTIGQRKGLGLSGGPWYVVAKDSEKNIIFISSKYFSEEKQRDTFRVSDLRWIVNSPIKSDFVNRDLEVKIRHGEHVYTCTLELGGNNCGHVKINGQDQGIAPGQFAVFYDGDICLGSGVIEG